MPYLLLSEEKKKDRVQYYMHCLKKKCDGAQDLQVGYSIFFAARQYKTNKTKQKTEQKKQSKITGVSSHCFLIVTTYLVATPI